MALPLPPGLVPTEVAFLCEMEMITIVPRQRLESISLLSGAAPVLRPPHRAQIPLWLALLLKKQRRANIVPPPWLHPASLAEILNHETVADPVAFSPPPPPIMRSDGRGAARPYDRAYHGGGAAAATITESERRKSRTTTTSRGAGPPDAPPLLSPPFLPSCTADAPGGYLPYHWLELSETLLAHASDDVPGAAEVRTLLRDLQEVRAAKMRGSTASLEGGGGVVSLRGVGAMELAESRGFVTTVVDGVRKLGASAEATRREEEERGEGEEEEDRGSDDDMGFE